MEVKIKNNNELIDAVIDMVDGVMVVSPKEVFKPKVGDIITCYNENNKSTYVLIFKSLEWEDTRVCHYCCHVIGKNDFYLRTNDWAVYKNARYATEDEKSKLFYAMEKANVKWDAEKCELVDLKWKPKKGERYYRPVFDMGKLMPFDKTWIDSVTGSFYWEKGWCFKTKEECQAFCQKLNEAINQVKP